MLKIKKIGDVFIADRIFYKACENCWADQMLCNNCFDDQRDYKTVEIILYLTANSFYTVVCDERGRLWSIIGNLTDCATGLARE